MGDQPPQDPRQSSPAPGQYQAAPAYESAPAYSAGPVKRPEQPSSIRTAFLLMCAGAVLSLIDGLLPLIMPDQMRAIIEDQVDGQEVGVPLDTMVQISIVYTMVLSVIGALLWALNATFCRMGHPWARIFGTVLFALAVLLTLGSLAQSGSSVMDIVPLISLLVGLVVVVLLWTPASSQFFARSSAARRGEPWV